MADLVIHDVPEELVRRLELRARERGTDLEGELARILEAALAEEGELSILDLEGLGKGLWGGRSVQEWLDEERRSWD